MKGPVGGNVAVNATVDSNEKTVSLPPSIASLTGRRMIPTSPSIRFERCNARLARRRTLIRHYQEVDRSDRLFRPGPTVCGRKRVGRRIASWVREVRFTRSTA
jgi:hypothetical protein